jgi:hypothetical protein
MLTVDSPHQAAIGRNVFPGKEPSTIKSTESSIFVPVNE